LFFRDDEILDTFNIDSENIETPPVQRRAAFRNKSMRSPSANNLDTVGGNDDNASDVGSDFSGRRKNHKFRSLNAAGESGGRPLGDRELVIKKKRESNTDLSEGRRAATDLEDELGSGLFDRFSSARKTLTRSSTRRSKKDDGSGEDSGPTTLAADESADKRRSDSNWRSKIANKFRKSSDSYDFVEAERGQELRDYLGQVTPKTEPTRRKPLNFDKDSASTPKANGSNGVLKNSVNGGPGRKSSYKTGDYDSTLVDGKYVTSVPIINIEEEVTDNKGKNLS
jgi:hypothetical protein